MTQQDLFGEPPAPMPKASRESKPARQSQYTWFFALRPSASDSQRIYTVADNLLASHSVTGKRITSDRLHITLELVGHDIDPEAVDRACRAADSVNFPVLEPRFDSIMTFSAPSGPVVLLGAEGLNEVRELRSLLVCAMAHAGFTLPRTYQPHMTLSYDPKHRLPPLPIGAISFPATEFALVKSHVGLSRHEVMRTWSLSDGRELKRDSKYNFYLSPRKNY